MVMRHCEDPRRGDEAIQGVTCGPWRWRNIPDAADVRMMVMRHCEDPRRGDEAIQGVTCGPWIASSACGLLAMTE
jgi:hypothetical protein